MGHLTEADPVAVAVEWLLSRETVTSVLGGSGRVGGENEPPYPCVRIIDPPGNDRTLRHLIAPILQIEALGDMDGSPGKAALRRCLYTVIEQLALLPDTPQVDETKPVVTAINSTGGGGWSPLPTGQPRYLATVEMYIHPPRVVPDPIP